MSPQAGERNLLLAAEEPQPPTLRVVQAAWELPSEQGAVGGTRGRHGEAGLLAKLGYTVYFWEASAKSRAKTPEEVGVHQQEVEAALAPLLCGFSLEGWGRPAGWVERGQTTVVGSG